MVLDEDIYLKIFLNPVNKINNNLKITYRMEKFEYISEQIYNMIIL